jgi:hypothetical protein
MRFHGTFRRAPPYSIAMKTNISLALAAMLLAAALPAAAQDADHSWSKTYPVTGKPTLNLETSDAKVTISACASCKAVSIHVEVEGRKLSEYHIEESQAGDQVHFHIWPREHVGFYIGVHHERTTVTVETPAELTLAAKTSDGNVSLTGLQGDIGLTAGDGDINFDHVSGNLHLKSGDGSVNIASATGALDASTSDGNLTVDGVFHALAVHTSDGRLDLNLREGTKLTEASSVQSSDGSITLRVPQNFAADLDVHTSDGHLDCALPIVMDHYHSSGGDGHEIHGRLNGGGTPLTIHTSDGNVKIEQI